MSLSRLTRACKHVTNLGDDFFTDTQLDDTCFDEQETKSRGAFLAGGALEKHHAVERRADLGHQPSVIPLPVRFLSCFGEELG